MKVFIDLLYITIVVSLIVDVSGIIDSIKNSLSKLLNCKPHQITLKPFECSLCSTFWCGLIYLIHYNELTLPNMAILMGLASSSSLISETFFTIKELTQKILWKINNI